MLGSIPPLPTRTLLVTGPTTPDDGLGVPP
jgi:hypothetical protein